MQAQKERKRGEGREQKKRERAGKKKGEEGRRRRERRGGENGRGRIRTDLEFIRVRYLPFSPGPGTAKFISDRS